MAILTVSRADLNGEGSQTTGDNRLAILPGSRIGLTGADDSATRALLHALAGGSTPEFDLQPAPMVRIGLYDSQDAPVWKAGTRLMDVLLGGRDDLRLLRARLAALEPLLAQEPAPPEALACRERLSRRYEQAGGPCFEASAVQVLAGLGWTMDDLPRPLAALGAAAETRARLARVLIDAPDVLLLHDPFRDLSPASARWLLGWLAASDSAWVVAGDGGLLDGLLDSRWGLPLAAAARIA